MGWYGHEGWVEVHDHVEEMRGNLARHSQEKIEATRLGKLFSYTKAQKFAKPHPLAKPTSRRNHCTDARRTETCVAPRHVD